ncbi:MAG: type III pantothenate kinase [Kordiimonadaceae bacterium]|nr:type III pantothenate kinase [Kordiimonadaceae bacterium]
MLLTIDAGNTNIVFALIEGEEIKEQWRLSTVDQRTVEEYIVWISHLMMLHGHTTDDVDGAIIASVVPPVDRPLVELCQKYFKCDPQVIGSASINLGIDVQVTNPHEVGADRLVNAVAANKRYKGPLVVVDFGTATNFDVVGEDGAYLGGLICPGINLSLSALHQAAAKLPRIAVAAPDHDRVTGKSTLEAMQFGVFWGYIGMIEGLITRLKKEHSSTLKVIATGGLASIFADRTDMIDHVNDALTLEGLRLIYKLNK